MKTLAKFGMAMMIALAFVGCKSNREAVQKNNNVNEINVKSNEEMLNIPCLNESNDDEQYYRALGTSTSSSMDNIRMLALRDARTKLMMKIAEIIGEGENVEFDVVCEKITIDMRGFYHGYVVLQVDKDSILHKE